MVWTRFANVHHCHVWIEWDRISGWTLFDSRRAIRNRSRHERKEVDRRSSSSVVSYFPSKLCFQMVLGEDVKHERWWSENQGWFQGIQRLSESSKTEGLNRCEGSLIDLFSTYHRTQQRPDVSVAVRRCPYEVEVREWHRGNTSTNK